MLPDRSATPNPMTAEKLLRPLGVARASSPICSGARDGR